MKVIEKDDATAPLGDYAGDIGRGRSLSPATDSLLPHWWPSKTRTWKPSL